MNEMHEANRASWNAAADWWRKRGDERGVWRRCHRDPALALAPAERPFLRDLQDQDVCVLGSGDNEVVFALAGMGARVTSVDISERQLEIAGERAGILGLSVSFVRADVTDLGGIADASFDLVYTGGHVCVWVSDIRTYYAEAVRVLRPGGRFVVNEYHPVRRMWLESDGSEPPHRYLHRGPYEERSDEGRPTYEFHWTVADHVQAVLDAGCRVVKVDEHGEGPEPEDYARNTPAALPMYLLIVGRKEDGRPPDQADG